jgi:hypothetical protein
MRNAPHLDQETLTRLLDYDPETGIFRWRERTDVRKAWNTRYAGKIAGFDWNVPNSNVTYRSIRIFDWPFLGHRLAWLYMTGEWPTHGVDHRDMDGLNNRWGNLRSATKAQNAANTKILRTNTTGFKGVSLSKNGRYRATIKINDRQKWLGYFDTPEEAHAAYCRAALERSGQYARFK